ncbi:MAG TPA: LysM peptidoglycan-binding domain-containing protein, partial [Solirubrobacterales bacterium]
MSFVASLDPSTPLSVKALFERFTGADPGFDLLVTDLLLAGETGSRSLQFAVALEPKLPFGVPVELETVSLIFDYAPNAFSGELVIDVTLLALPFMLRAAYNGDGQGWNFSGLLLPAGQRKSLQDVVDALGYTDPLPAGLGAVQLRGLSASFSTEGSAYRFDGVLGWPLNFPALGLEVDIEAELALARTAATAPVSGFARGAVRVNELSLGVVYAFGIKGSSTLAFEVAYRRLVLTCVISKNAKGDTILRANLGGVSFGDILGYLVGLATGRSDFQFSAPWDVLYQLRFDELWLEIDMKTRAVSVTYEPKVDLGIVSIDRIGLKYSKYAGSPSVDLSIAGSFAGVEFGKEEPLQWDVLNDPPPSPPGKGEQLLDLRYLGLGQNVALRTERRFSGVLDVIETLERDFRPVPAETPPLSKLEALKFSGDGRWLIGADFTLMSAVSIAGVFADPTLYGLRIGLAGPRVKALSGLEFEVLYQKVSDSIGLYHIELTLPTAMRQLQFGAVAVTLPIVSVDIYTNGNFYLDFGFPTGGDYSRSFSIQAGIFVGRGGFYFGVLDGATSDQVPVVVNGAFSPVIEFGVGLSVGFGRTLEAGIVSGGLTVTLESVVQGVLGWFNPTDRSLPSDLFYNIKGSAAIVGKAWGCVDFVIVKATFSVTAFASVTLELEAYAPTLVELKVGVEVSASLKILFFTVSFSFSTTLDLSFSIGEGSQPPWQIAAPAAVARPLQLRRMRSRHRLKPALPLDVQRRQRLRRGLAPSFDWSPRAVMDDAPVDVALMLTPTMTAAFGEGGAPEVQIVVGLFLETSTPLGARHADEVRRVTDPAADEAPFNLLAAGVLRWALSSLRTPLAPAGSIAIADLEAIEAFLSDRGNRDATFTYKNVVGLIEENFVLRVTNPVDPAASRAADLPPQIAVFPMVPEVSMSPQGQPTIDFRTHSLADRGYRDRLEAYYDQLQVRPPDRAAAAKEGVGNEEAVSVTLFCDYFGLVAQQAVKQAAETLDAYPYEPSGEETLLEIATGFGGWLVEHRVRRGDTAATIAAEHGATVAELRRANPDLAGAGEKLAPGSTVAIEIGPTVGRIAAANPSYPLRAGATLGIAGVRHEVRAQETLGQIAAAFQIDQPGTLFASEPANASSTALLRPGAALVVPPVPYTVEAADLCVPEEARRRIAANFYTRARRRGELTTAERKQVEWYVATIGAGAPDFSGTIPIPLVSLDKAGQMTVTGETSYVVKPSDTVEGVAAMFALLQLAPDDAAFAAYLAPFPPGPYAVGQIVTLPTVSLPLRSGDTLAALAGAFYLDPTGPDGAPAGVEEIADANAGADVLAPRAVLAIPPVEYAASAGDSLGAVAERLDLTVEELADSV